MNTQQLKILSAMTNFFQIAFSKKVFYTGLKVSLLVGTILNLINQTNSSFHIDIENVSCVKICLTYLVPYLVSTYSGSMAIIRSPKKN